MDIHELVKDGITYHIAVPGAKHVHTNEYDFAGLHTKSMAWEEISCFTETRFAIEPKVTDCI